MNRRDKGDEREGADRTEREGADYLPAGEHAWAALYETYAVESEASADR